MNLQLDDEMRAHLRMILEDDIECQEDHISWLKAHKDEPDRGTQMQACYDRIRLDKEACDALGGTDTSSTT